MGIYVANVNDAPAKGKVKWLEQRGAIPAHHAMRHENVWEHVKQLTPEGHLPIVVVENWRFEAAMVLITPYDWRRVHTDPSPRPRTWLTMPLDRIRPLVEPRKQNQLPQDAHVWRHAPSQ